MAEITSSGTHVKHRATGRKKKSTRVDLTPMVDLGFLLITFFVFTTSLTEANAMNLVLPDDKPVKDPSLAPVSKTISLILGAGDTIYYYDGLSDNDMKKTSYAGNGVRAVLQEKIRLVNNLYGKPGETIVLIKPTVMASYRNLVDVLDEMRINGVSKYVLMEASGKELQGISLP